MANGSQSKKIGLPKTRQPEIHEIPKEVLESKLNAESEVYEIDASTWQ